MKKQLLKISNNVKAAIKAVNDNQVQKPMIAAKKKMRKVMQDMYLEQAYLDELAYRE